MPYTLSKEQQDFVIELRSKENQNHGVALDAIEIYIENNLDNLDEKSVLFLQKHLFEIAQRPELFEKATLQLSKIYYYESTTDDFKQYCKLFTMNDKTISDDLKNKTLSYLFNPESSGFARILGFSLLNEIMPTGDKTYDELILKLLYSVQPEDDERVSDFILTTLENWIENTSWNYDLQQIIQEIVINICSTASLSVDDLNDLEDNADTQEELSDLAKIMANYIPKGELLDEALRFCCEDILQGDILTADFAYVFLNKIVIRFPIEFFNYFLDKPAVLIEDALLLTVDDEWSDIGIFVFEKMNDNLDFLDSINNFLIDMKGKKEACRLLTKILGIDVPQHVKTWLNKILGISEDNVKKAKKVGFSEKNDLRKFFLEEGRKLSKKVSSPHDRKPKLKRSAEADDNPSRKKTDTNPIESTCPSWNNFTQQQYITVYNGHEIKFSEKIILGDGNCAFTSAQFERENVIDTLLAKKMDAELRRKFVAEIRAEWEICFSQMSQSNVDELQNNLKPVIRFLSMRLGFQKQIDELAQKIKNDNPKLGAKNLRNDFDEFPDSQDKTMWKKLVDGVDKAEELLNESFASEMSFEDYMSQCKNNGQWVSTVALIEYARIQNINLVIWKKPKVNSTQLIMDSSHGDVMAANTIHLHFKYNHFDRLERCERVDTVNNSQQNYNFK